MQGHMRAPTATEPKGQARRRGRMDELSRPHDPTEPAPQPKRIVRFAEDLAPDKASSSTADAKANEKRIGTLRNRTDISAPPIPLGRRQSSSARQPLLPISSNFSGSSNAQPYRGSSERFEKRPSVAASRPATLSSKQAWEAAEAEYQTLLMSLAPQERGAVAFLFDRLVLSPSKGERTSMLRSLDSERPYKKRYGSMYRRYHTVLDTRLLHWPKIRTMRILAKPSLVSSQRDDKALDASPACKPSCKVAATPFVRERDVPRAFLIDDDGPSYPTASSEPLEGLDDYQFPLGPSSDG